MANYLQLLGEAASTELINDIKSYFKDDNRVKYIYLSADLQSINVGIYDFPERKSSSSSLSIFDIDTVIKSSHHLSMTLFNTNYELVYALLRDSLIKVIENRVKRYVLENYYYKLKYMNDL